MSSRENDAIGEQVIEPSSQGNGNLTINTGVDKDNTLVIRETVDRNLISPVKTELAQSHADIDDNTTEEQMNSSYVDNLQSKDGNERNFSSRKHMHPQ